MGLENLEGLLMDINAHNQNVQENGSKNKGTLEVIPNQFLMRKQEEERKELKSSDLGKRTLRKRKKTGDAAEKSERTEAEKTEDLKKRKRREKAKEVAEKTKEQLNRDRKRCEEEQRERDQQYAIRKEEEEAETREERDRGSKGGDVTGSRGA